MVTHTLGHDRHPVMPEITSFEMDGQRRLRFTVLDDGLIYEAYWDFEADVGPEVLVKEAIISAFNLGKRTPR